MPTHWLTRLCASALLTLLLAAALPCTAAELNVRQRTKDHAYLTGGRADGLAVGDRLLIRSDTTLIAELEVEFVAPRTPAEKAVARIWQDVLGAAEVGAQDSFFELGGHSLDAVRVMARVNGEFGTDLPLKTIFEAQTVAELARRVESAPGSGRDQSMADRVAPLPPDTDVLPGHGPATTLARELASNPFLQALHR